MERDGFLEFVWLPTFERTSRGLLDDNDCRALEFELLANPLRGALVPRTGGFRKMRWAMPGRGKRGGLRIIYYFRAFDRTVFMVLAYGKNVKDELTEGERLELKRLAAIIEGRSSQ